MERFTGVLSAEEQATLRLQQLYQRYGFRKYRMSRFEEYRLYLENQSFLPSEQVITFTDLDGRLLALKPDVTLSIVKNARGDGGLQRLYYTEKVYRASRESGEYREISQMGLELLGCVDGYAKAQVVRLALGSLKTIGRRCLLDLSHMGFALGLLEEMKAPAQFRTGLLDCLRDKNAPQLRSRALEAGLSQSDAELLGSLTTLYGPFLPTLGRARALARGPVMARALDQLEQLYEAIPDPDKAELLQLDFSITNDISYYNGIIFQGFVEGVPHSLLAGGQYDRLMERFGKRGGAMGFALYLDELDRLADPAPALDGDLLLEYSGVTPARVAQAVEEYTAAGNTVLACPAPAPRHLRCARKAILDQNGLREVEPC